MEAESGKSSKYRKCCSVVGCMSSHGPMFKFPKNVTQRLQWKQTCKIVKDVTNYMFICGRHFTDSEIIAKASGRHILKKDAVPSQHLPSADSLILRKAGPYTCTVRGCNYGLRDTDTLHRFPACPARQEEWRVAVQAEGAVSKSTRICCRHFEPTDFRVLNNGKKVLSRSAFPTLLLPGTDDATGCLGEECLTSSTRWKAFCKSCQVSAAEDIGEVQDKSHGEGSGSDTDENEKLQIVYSDSDSGSDCETPADPEELTISEVLGEIRTSVLSDLTGPESADVNNVLTQLTAATGRSGSGFEALFHQLHLSEKETKIGHEVGPLSAVESTASFSDCATQTDLTLIQFNLLHLIQNDVQCKSFLGVTLKTLQTIADMCQTCKPVSHNSALTMKERVAMVLCKLYLNISLECIGILFGVSRQVCSHTFSPTVQLMHSLMDCLVRWPTKEENLKNMPTCFKKFKNTRVVLDCTEIPVDSPRCLQCRIRMYSHYKGRLTAKILLGVSPCGLIIYRSLCYGGKASDNKIFAESALITENLLEPFSDAVMVDKGFKIDKILEERNIKKHQPPFVRKKMPLSEQAAHHNVAVAVARVHVERVIQRMKLFQIISNKIPWYVMPDIDAILTIICGLVNLGSPVLAKERFLTQSDCNHYNKDH